MKKSVLFLPLLAATLACTFSVNTFPVTTPTVAVTPQATLTFTPEPAANVDATVTGKLSYPSEFIPAMRVVLFGLTNGKAYFVDTALNQAIYSLQVPAGTYYVVSYAYAGTPGETGSAASFALSGGAFAGGYTQMMPCGLAYGCDDHTLIPVKVSAGETAAADPGDWYAPEGTFPPMPEP